MTSEPPGQDSRAELFEAIGHPTRIKILQVLHDNPMGFADLKRAVGVESSGNTSFHLTKLRDLVRTAPDGNYVLTDDGREALWSVGNITGTREVGGNRLHITRTGRTRQRAWVTIIVVALLLISGVAVFEQNQLATQEAQIKSQQGQIALYVNQARPFTSGQGASLVLGHADFSAGFPNLLPPSIDTMNSPTQALFDFGGNLWVVDSVNNRVLAFKPPFSDGMDAFLVIGQKNFTTAVSSSASDGFTGQSVASLYNNIGPTGAAFDHFGNLWVADSPDNRLVEFKPPFATGMNASIVIGQKNFTTNIPGYPSGRSSRDALSFPTSPVFDSSGDLWFADSYNNRVLEFKPPFSNGMDASLVIGQKNFEAHSSSVTQSTLRSAQGNLAIDPSGNIWVADSLNNRILEFKPPFSNGMNASFVLGQPDFTTVRISPSLGQWGSVGDYWTVGLVFDSRGNLWTNFNDRLLEFIPPFSSNMQASLELGQPDFTSNAWIGGQNGMHRPGIPSLDPLGNLWVPDTGNSRVLEFTSAYTTSNNPSFQQTTQPFWQLPYVAVASGLVIAGVLVLVLIRKRRTRKE